MSLEAPCCSSLYGALPRAPLSTSGPFPLPGELLLMAVICPPLWRRSFLWWELLYSGSYAQRGAAHASDRSRRTTARSPCFKEDCLVVWFMPRASLDQAVAGTSQRPHPCSAPSPSCPVSLRLMMMWPILNIKSYFPLRLVPSQENSFSTCCDWDPRLSFTSREAFELVILLCNKLPNLAD